MKAIKFINWTDEDFTHTWDGEVYSFPAGEPMLLPEGLAQHFAKHLVDRELNKKNLPTNHFSRQSFENKCLVGSSLESRTPEHLNASMLNEVPLNNEINTKVEIEPEEESEEVVEDVVVGDVVAEAPVAKKPAKKGRPFAKKEVKEEEFPDLNA